VVLCTYPLFGGTTPSVHIGSLTEFCQHLHQLPCSFNHAKVATLHSHTQQLVMLSALLSVQGHAACWYGARCCRSLVGGWQLQQQSKHSHNTLWAIWPRGPLGRQEG
jgi:hypothetical protein